LFSLQDAILKGTLNAAINELTEDISFKVLGKRKLEDSDSIAVDSGVELSCDIFRRLRQGEWFNAWNIRAAMQISDRPFFVRYGHSVPLDELGRNNRIKPIKRPLAGWAREISTLRQEAKDVGGDAGALIHFRPLNHNNNHFTLLEINEGEEKIRHYDSMVNKDMIEGIAKLTRVGKLV
jgi:hypothetical protein